MVFSNTKVQNINILSILLFQSPVFNSIAGHTENHCLPNINICRYSYISRFAVIVVQNYDLVRIIDSSVACHIFVDTPSVPLAFQIANQCADLTSSSNIRGLVSKKFDVDICTV